MVPDMALFHSDALRPTRILGGIALAVMVAACGAPSSELYPNVAAPNSAGPTPVLDQALPDQQLAFLDGGLDPALITTYQDAFEGSTTWYALNENPLAATLVFRTEAGEFEAVLAQPGMPLPLGFTPIDLIDVR